MEAGDHANAGGGFSSGSAECGNLRQNNGYNGMGGIQESDLSITWGVAGGYYTCPYQVSSLTRKVHAWFGEGGGGLDSNWISRVSMGGSGGKAGSGGNITYSNNSKIFAYNGDMITNNDYTTEYYEWDINSNYKLVNGNKNKLQVIKKKNIVDGKIVDDDNSLIIPAKIFAQEGIIRETYKYNALMTTQECADYGVNSITSNSNFENVKISNFSTTNVLNYKNGYMTNQGIGSGAGYLESSNGTFIPIN